MERRSLAFRSPFFMFFGVVFGLVGIACARGIDGAWGVALGAVFVIPAVLFAVAGGIGTRVVVDEHRRTVELWSLPAVLHLAPPVVLPRDTIEHITLAVTRSDDDVIDLYSVVIATTDGKRHAVGVGASSYKGAREAEGQEIAAFLGVPVKMA